MSKWRVGEKLHGPYHVNKIHYASITQKWLDPQAIEVVDQVRLQKEGQFQSVTVVK